MASALGCGDGGRVRASGGVALDQGAEHVQAPALPGLALLGKPALELLGVGQAKAVEERPAVERGRGGEQVETDVAQPRARQGDRSGKIDRNQGRIKGNPGAPGDETVRRQRLTQLA